MTTGGDSSDLGELRTSLIGHLVDLRTMFLQIILALALGFSAAVPIAPHVMKIIKDPLKISGIGNPDDFLKVMEVSGGFTAAMQIIVWIGVAISSPLTLWALGRFLFPALKQKEKRYVLGAIVMGAIFFVAGVVSAYYFIVPFGLAWLYSVNSWVGVKCDFILLKDYVDFVGQVLLAVGISFEVPVLVMILGCLGVIKSAQLKEWRRIAIVLLMIAAMLLTPGGDPVSMICVTIPMVLMYEACIWLIWLKERNDQRAEQADS